MYKLHWSKGYFLILSKAVGLLLIILSVGYIVISENFIYFKYQDENFKNTINEFTKTRKPIVSINFWALYGANSKFEVLHPLLNSYTLKVRDENPSCIDDFTELSNKKIKIENRPIISKFRNSILNNDFIEGNQGHRKLMILEDFLNFNKKLPEDFISKPPYIDEWNQSFAYSLVQKANSTYNDKKWVEQHLAFFKISELKNILSQYKITDLKYNIISKLTEVEVEEIIKASPLVLTSEYLFLKSQSRFGFTPLIYWVFDLKEFKEELKKSKFDLVFFSEESLCLQKMGNGCWTYNSKHAMNYLYRYSLIIIILILIIILIFVGLYFKSQYQKNKQQIRNRMALQVLSHEFRTPVSSMLLLIEQLTKSYNKFETKESDLITRLSGDIYKLQRVVELSRTYLQAERHRVVFRNIEIESINNWIVDLTSELNSQINYDLLKQDQALIIDPYWLKFILTNLIQNGVQHGKVPILIRITKLNSKLAITVEDQGHCEFSTLNQMTTEFVKSGKSTGMGLGLNIIKFIIDDWGGEFVFSKNPTAFSIILNEKGPS